MKIQRSKLEHVTKKTYLQYLKLFPVLQKQRTKEYSMPILTFGTMVFFGIFAINPTLTTIAELHRKLEDVRFVEKELSAKIANISRLQSTYLQLEEDIPIIEQAIPDRPLAPQLLGQLRAIVNQSGVTLIELSTKDLQIVSNPPLESGEFEFTMQVSGTYQQVYEFLTLVSNFNRIVVVESLSITKQAITDTTMVVSISGIARFGR